MSITCLEDSFQLRPGEHSRGDIISISFVSGAFNQYAEGLHVPARRMPELIIQPFP